MQHGFRIRGLPNLLPCRTIAVLRKALGALILAACSEVSRPDETRGPGIHLVAGAGLSDTIASQPTQPLLIEVRDGAGRPVPNTPVWIFGDTTHVLRIWVAKDTSRVFLQRLLLTTDASGFVAVRVAFGLVAGSAAVRIVIPALNAEMLAPFTILPGTPVRFVIAPRDTAVFEGATYRLSAAPVDRLGNAHPAEVSYSTESPNISVASDGTVSARSTGLGIIHVRHASVADTVRVSVVPNAVVAAFREYATGSALVTMELDGSNQREITRFSSGDLRPAWSPDARFIVVNGPDNRLYRVTLDGAVARLLPPSTLSYERNAQFSSNGEWIYFEGSSGGGVEIWRARSDGSATERVVTNAEQPSPAPDGSRVAFVDSENVIHVLNVSTGQRVAVATGTATTAPRWSPNGEWIAFNSYTGVRIVRPDGTGHRVLAMNAFTAPVSWSPDGRFILQIAMVIDVGSGEVLRIPVGAGIRGLAWRP